MTDVEVRTATDDAITSATAVPWCYYNVFFIFYESCESSILDQFSYAIGMSFSSLFYLFD